MKVEVLIFIPLKQVYFSNVLRTVLRPKDFVGGRNTTIFPLW